jgi:ribosomal protein L2
VADRGRVRGRHPGHRLRVRCIAVEREADYLPLIVARITRQRDPVAHVALVGDEHPTLFDEVTP